MGPCFPTHHLPYEMNLNFYFFSDRNNLQSNAILLVSKGGIQDALKVKKIHLAIVELDKRGAKIMHFAMAIEYPTTKNVGSSITRKIIINFQNQLAKLLLKMEHETLPKATEDLSQPSDNSLPQTNPSQPSSVQYYPSDLENSAKEIKIQNESNQPFHAFHSSSKGSSQSDQPADANTKKPSIFHNFQKHLITTLKTHITFHPTRRGEPTDRLMVSLWRYFIKSCKPTKKYLYSLLMSVPHSLTEFQHQCSDKTFQQQFDELIRQASQEEIMQAQCNLRFHLMEQSKRLLKEGELNHRRMHKLEEFKQYFATFIQDLQSGQLNLRLPKKNRNTQMQIKRNAISRALKKQGEQ